MRFLEHRKHSPKFAVKWLACSSQPSSRWAPSSVSSSKCATSTPPQLANMSSPETYLSCKLLPAGQRLLRLWRHNSQPGVLQPLPLCRYRCHRRQQHRCHNEGVQHTQATQWMPHHGCACIITLLQSLSVTASGAHRWISCVRGNC